MFNAMVSRPVGRKEMMEDPDAKASMRNEWLGQHKQGVYDFSVIREYDDVVAEAKREGKEVHMARVHGICVEKNYQLPRGALDVNSKEEAFYLAIKLRTSTGKPRSFKTSAIQRHLKPPGGQISMVVSPATM